MMEQDHHTTTADPEAKEVGRLIWLHGYKADRTMSREAKLGLIKEARRLIDKHGAERVKAACRGMAKVWPICEDNRVWTPADLWKHMEKAAAEGQAEPAQKILSIEEIRERELAKEAALLEKIRAEERAVAEWEDSNPALALSYRREAVQNARKCMSVPEGRPTPGTTLLAAEGLYRKVVQEAIAGGAGERRAG